MTKRLPAMRAFILAASVLPLVAAPSHGQEFDPAQQIGPDPVLPEPSSALVTGMKVATVVRWKEGQTPTVPDGLMVSAYAGDLANPRNVYTLPNGDVLVVQSKAPTGKPVFRPKDVIRGWIMAIASGSGGEQKPTNLITLLRDTNRDGTPEDRYDLLTDLNSPFGVTWFEDKLYVAATDAILVYPYRLGESAITAPPTVLTPLPGGPINHHWTKDLVLSPDGRFLYASVGSNSNIAENGLEAEKGRAAIWQVDRVTGASRVFASGLRNPNGLVFNPQSGELWAAINERDELGPDLVPDYVTSVKDGGFYGWPWSYYGNHVDPRMRPERPDLVASAIKPDYSLGSHVAPLGMTFADRSALPEQYRSGAFVGQRGSWNRNTFTGYKVVWLPFENGRPSGMTQDVVTGFLDGDTARGRPVGVGIDGTGALLIADDVGNTVWRVAAADGTITPEPVGSDAVVVGAVQPPQDAPATGAVPEAPAGDAAPVPSQTDIAPAVLPPETQPQAPAQ